MIDVYVKPNTSEFRRKIVHHCAQGLISNYFMVAIQYILETHCAHPLHNRSLQLMVRGMQHCADIPAHRAKFGRVSVKAKNRGHTLRINGRIHLTKIDFFWGKSETGSARPLGVGDNACLFQCA